MEVLREEFRWKNFSLAIPQPEIFHLSKFQSVTPFLLFLIRSIIALFYTAMYITAVTEFGSWISFFFLTDVTYLIVTLHFIVSWIVSLVAWRSSDSTSNKRETRMEADDGDSVESQKVSSAYYRFLQFTWVLCTIAVDAALLVSLLYWAVVYRSVGQGIRAYLNIEQHGIFLIPILINFVIGLPPIRILHGIYTIIFASVYVATIAILWKTDGFAPYPVLDFSKLSTALLTSLLSIFIGVPVIHLCWFGIYRLILKIQERSMQPLPTNSQSSPQDSKPNASSSF